jgi:hypothetical protein
MQFLIRNPKDFWSGVIFACVGTASLFISSDYERGTAGTMGPGYFPTMLGWLLALIGVIAIVRSMMVRGEAIGRFAIGKAALILLSTLAFGLLIRGAGLAAAIVVLVMTAGYASERFSLKKYAALALGMAAFCGLVFVLALGLPFPMFGNWLGK